ncbi:MAG: hypothetical protein KatS3mg131_2418 [Candidatus Tectimicrobiota bacterium]|nr:MAG: hypothetical protein KatS3mg131_2418 [Candidatus Tectomicrobia bacterium]
MQERGGERRRARRVPTKILLRYGDAEQFFTDYIHNLSRGGIFVPTHTPLPPGTQLRIGFALPYCDRLIVTTGVVVHSVHADPRTGLGPSGMGIKFQSLSEEDLELIDKYVESLLV